MSDDKPRRGRPPGGKNQMLVGQCWYYHPDNNQWYRVTCRRDGHSYWIAPVGTGLSEHYREPWPFPTRDELEVKTRDHARLKPLTVVPPTPA